MRRTALVCSSALVASVSGCFNPEDPMGTGAGTADSSGTDATDPSVTDPSTTAPSTSNPSDPSDTDPSDTDPSDTDPSDTDPSDTDPTDTDPSDTADSTDTDSTGAPAMCGDGSVDPGEYCIDDKPTVFNVGAGSFDVALADVDDVAGLDIITLNRSSSTVSVLGSDGVGGFGNADSHTVGDGSCRIRAIDGDGDDDIDLVISGAPIVTLDNDGTGDFNRINAPFDASSFGGCGDYNDMDVLNNGGGPIDIVFSGEYNNSFVAGISNASGWTFADNATSINNAGEGSSGVTVTELAYDPDDNPDVIQLNKYSNTGTIFRGTGNGTFVEDGEFVVCAAVAGPEEFVGARWATAGDLNGDGQTDIVTSCITGQLEPAGGFSIVFGAADGTFSAETVVTLGGAFRVVLPDIDGDGDLDMLVASSVMQGVAVYLNDGTGVFAEPIGLSVGAPAFNVAVDDLDGDVALDVVVPYDTAQGGRVAVFFATP